MVRQGLLMGLAILLLAPIASAVDSTGTFTAHGPISLPAGSHASLDMLALLDTDTRTLETLVLETPSLRVLEVEHREAYVDPGLGSLGFLGQTGIRERSWLLTDVRLALVEGEHAGFVGAYPRASSTMEMVLEGASTLSPRKTSIISTSDQGVETADPPEGRFYSQRIHEPHLYARAPGVASIWGGGAIKILGPDIRITAAENTTIHQTGQERIGKGALTEVVTRMLFLEWEQGTLELASPEAPMEVAAASATDVRMDGMVRFHPRSGSLATTDIIYRASGGPERLDGQFAASINPILEAGEARAILNLDGDLRATTLTPSPVVTRAPSVMVDVALLLVGVVVGGGVVAATSHQWRRWKATGRPIVVTERASLAIRRLTTRHTLEECLALAEQDMECERFERAAYWYERAHALDPDEPEHVMEQAACLAMAGRREEALALYDRASAMSVEGIADRDAARLLLEMDELARAEVRILRALDRSPELTIEIYEDEELFSRLFGRPAFEAAMDQAEARLLKAGR